MATLAELNVAIGVKLDSFEAGLKELEQGIGRLGKRLEGIGEGLTKAVTVPLGLLGAASLKASADLDALRRGLTAVSGSSEAASEEFEKLREVARLPGLGLREAVQGSTNLQAAGFSADQARKSLLAYGNALATVGKGKAELDGVITALTQISAKGKISAEEINQIAERVPQIRRVIKAAFGTSSSEDLQRLGISAEEFIQKTTEELSKLPKVTGGLSNAFENFSDSAFQSLSRVGDVVNRVFNVEGLLAKFADVLDRVSSAFASLSPVAQKFITVGAAIAAAIGPVALVVGKVISLIPTLTAVLSALGGAFTVLTGPVGLLVAAIAGAVALIIANWDSIVQYFTSGPGADVFNEVKAVVSEAMRAIGAAVALAVDIIRTYWAAFKTFVIPVVLDTFGRVLPLVSDILGGLSAVFRTIGALLSGDWQGVWDGLVNIAKRAVNIILEVVRIGLTQSAGVVATILEKLGVGESIAKGLRGAISAVDSFTNSLKFSFGGAADAATEGADAVSEQYFAMREAAERAADGVTTATVRMSKDQTDALAKVAASLRQVEQENMAFGASYDYVGERAAALQKGISTLIESGFNAQSRAVRKLISELNTLGAAQKAASGSVAPVRTPTLEQAAPTLKFDIDTSNAQQAADLVSRVNAQIGQSVTATGEQVAAFGARMRESYTQTLDLTGAISSAIADFAELIGQSLASAFSGDFNAGNFFKGILKIVARFVGQIGQMLISYGVGMKVFAVAVSNPATAIAAGAALVALAGAIGSFASRGPGGGGSGSGQTAQTAPRSGLSFDPAPVQTAVRQTVAVNAATPQGSTDFRVTLDGGTLRLVNSGNEILAIIENAQNRNRRTGG